jgi:hypothetical protein
MDAGELQAAISHLKEKLQVLNFSRRMLLFLTRERPSEHRCGIGAASSEARRRVDVGQNRSCAGLGWVEIEWLAGGQALEEEQGNVLKQGRANQATFIQRERQVRRAPDGAGMKRGRKGARGGELESEGTRERGSSEERGAH